MNNITITDYQEFEKIKDSIENSLNKIKAVFDNENKNIESINETEIWTSYIQKSLVNKYYELKENYVPIENSLNIIIEFMNNTIHSYKEAEKIANNSITDNIDNLNVNS